MDNKLAANIDSMVVSNNLELMDNADSELLAEHVHQVQKLPELRGRCKTCRSFRLQFEFAEIAGTIVTIAYIALMPYQMQSMAMLHEHLLLLFASVPDNTRCLMSSAEQNSHFHSTKPAILEHRFHSNRDLLQNMIKHDNQRQLILLFQRKGFKQ